MIRFFCSLVVVLFALASLGCARAVAGTADVELTYTIDLESPEGAAYGRADARFGEDIRALVMRRLVAGHVGADVSDEGRRLKIVVDERYASYVDELVTWPGTLAFHEPDPTYSAVPRGGHGLALREDVRAGVVDRYWEGTRLEVSRAVVEWTVDRDHRLLAEPMWATAQPGREPRWRTRVVRARAIGELGDGIMVGWGERGTLRLRALHDSPSANVLTVARARRDLHDKGINAALPDVLVRGRISLGAPTVEGDAAHLAFGTGVEAWSRAQDEKLVLTSSRLPPLRRAGTVGLPTNTGLATACVVVPIVLSLGWLLFVRRFDRAHPEPIWLVLVTFVLGALAPFAAGAVELILATSSPWLDPRVMSFGGQTFAIPIAFIVFTITVGIPEEGAKLLATMFAARRREFDEPIDGVLYGIVASLGFAAAENVQYFANARLNATTVIARCFMSVPAHMFFGALWGHAMGARLVDKRIRVGSWFILAAAMHGLFDTFLSMEGTAMLAVLLNLGLATTFVVLVQRSLRHGVVDAASIAVLPHERLMFRVGRPILFALAAVAVHLLAAGIFVLGAFWQLSRHRPGLGFVVGSSVMLGLLAIAVFGVSATVPLDIVIDAYGVTFGGAARRWSKIRSFAKHDDHIVLDCEGGPIHLGPGTPEVIDEVAAELTVHVGGGGARLKTLESN